MFSPKVDVPKDIMDEDPTSILRVFGDFNSRVRSIGGNSITQTRNMSSSSMGGMTSASQRLRLD